MYYIDGYHLNIPSNVYIIHLRTHKVALFGFSEVLLINRCVITTHHKIVRASVGNVFFSKPFSRQKHLLTAHVEDGCRSGRMRMMPQLAQSTGDRHHGLPARHLIKLIITHRLTVQSHNRSEKLNERRLTASCVFSMRVVTIMASELSSVVDLAVSRPHTARKFAAVEILSATPALSKSTL
jgi:hypothetical protein